MRVQGVEGGLDEQEVGPAVEEAQRLLVVGLLELGEASPPRAPGSFTSRDREAVLFVGPRAPATQQTRPGSSAITPSTASRAARAAATLMS